MFFLARLVGRRFGPLGYALTAYALWRRLPKRQRERIVDAVRAPHNKRAPRPEAAQAGALPRADSNPSAS